MQEISYKNLDFWHLGDLAALGGISLWKGGWMPLCLDVWWDLPGHSPNGPPSLTHATFLAHLCQNIWCVLARQKGGSVAQKYFYVLKKIAFNAIVLFGYLYMTLYFYRYPPFKGLERLCKSSRVKTLLIPFGPGNHGVPKN